MCDLRQCREQWSHRARMTLPGSTSGVASDGAVWVEVPVPPGAQGADRLWLAGVRVAGEQPAVPIPSAVAAVAVVSCEGSAEPWSQEVLVTSRDTAEVPMGWWADPVLLGGSRSVWVRFVGQHSEDDTVVVLFRWVWRRSARSGGCGCA